MNEEKETIRLLFLDTEKNKVSDIDAEQVIENYATLLKADELIHVNNMPVRIQGNEYQILYNDHITYFKDYPESVIKNGQTIARGNILICRKGKYSNPTSLDDADINLILRSIFQYFKKNKETGEDTYIGLTLSLDPGQSNTIVITDKNGEELFN